MAASNPGFLFQFLSHRFPPKLQNEILKQKTQFETIDMSERLQSCHSFQSVLSYQCLLHCPHILEKVNTPNLHHSWSKAWGLIEHRKTEGHVPSPRRALGTKLGKEEETILILFPARGEPGSEVRLLQRGM